ncbi:MAG: glycosyltransferase family 8 protein [Lachnospiraceae bacterium]|nr:glycosyltransferase family 8 protein [Lachnospiraceae bacterium]
MEKKNILVTLDENYVPPLKVMLYSLFLNNPGEEFHIYLLGEDFPEEKAEEINRLIKGFHGEFSLINVPEGIFDEAPVFRHYTKAMYYRLLASTVLPSGIDRILYLDPDILIINPVKDLYDMELNGNLFGAGIHEDVIGMTEYMNKVRLSAYDAEGYFNSGVLVMDLKEQRDKIYPEDIYAYVEKHKNELILPDQDILNGLYSDRIEPFDDSMYNYDARKFQRYLLLSKGVKTIDWVMEHTAVLHFCGRNKPWKPYCKNRFALLYKHYEKKCKAWEKHMKTEE